MDDDGFGLCRTCHPVSNSFKSIGPEAEWREEENENNLHNANKYNNFGLLNVPVENGFVIISNVSHGTKKIKIGRNVKKNV